MTPTFLKLTAVTGETCYVNFNFVATFTTDTFNDKPVTAIFFLNDDEPLAVQEAPDVILNWIDMEIAGQKERVDFYRSKLTYRREEIPK